MPYFLSLFTQKRKERAAAVEKSKKLTQEQKKKRLSIMENGFMSSEDSGGDDDTIIIHPIPWRSQHVNDMFRRIDEFCKATKSTQARRQLKTRHSGCESARPQPVEVPNWAIRQQ